MIMIIIIIFIMIINNNILLLYIYINDTNNNIYFNLSISIVHLIHILCTFKPKRLWLKNITLEENCNLENENQRENNKILKYSLIGFLNNVRSPFAMVRLKPENKEVFKNYG